MIFVFRVCVCVCVCELFVYSPPFIPHITFGLLLLDYKYSHTQTHVCTVVF
ncbi:hypothetical protein EXN66_Car003567 [Channa argus]|uniref:Uncharacterized protein n=1 Tax=Channa argus TaxID=215402 RepID=A0A6G1PCB2_CHAAH|nr:hypothetical protein EXN66_Car003567 [Channa argus]